MSEILQFKGSEIGLDEKSTITVSAHPGETAIDRANELNELLGPVFLDLIGAQSVENTEQAKTARQEAMATAVKSLYKIIPAGELQPLAKRILAFTSVSKEVNGETKVFKLNDKADFNLYFQRNLKALIPIMRRVIEFNGFLELDISALILETERE